MSVDLDRFIGLLIEDLKWRYNACEDFAATPSSILLAVLNAVCAARDKLRSAETLPHRFIGAEDMSYSTQEWVVNWDRVERLDDVIAILRALRLSFPADCSTLPPHVMRLCDLREKGAQDTVHD